MKKRTITVVILLVLIFTMFITVYAYADTCIHNPMYQSSNGGQYTESTTTTCPNSSSPHSHFRHVWGTYHTYKCAKCGFTWIEDGSYVYGEWECSLTDFGK